MLDFVRKAFRGGLEVILWINLILSAIVGGIAGYYLGQLISYRNAGGFGFLGVIIGLVCGLLTDIIGGGLIATILNMDENIEEQSRLLSEIVKKSSSLSQGNISSSGNRSIVGNKLQKTCKNCKKEVDEDYTGCPYCGNNTFE